MQAPFQIPSPEQFLFALNGVDVWVKRDDLIHPAISGNKWRKLKYWLEEFRQSQKTDILTFGGAFSNHLAATAAAGNHFNIPTHALVRGDEVTQNPTLDFCKKMGMRIETISRGKYALKDEPEFLEELHQLLPHVFVIPEGGKGKNGWLGCSQILDELENDYDLICIPAGTGTTAAGILANPHPAKVLIFPALKGGHFLKRAILQMLDGHHIQKNWEIIGEYHFGGFGKTTDALITFMNGIYETHQLKLDPIYTGKMLFGLMDLIQQNKIEKGSRALILHTGGLQGITGMNEQLLKKNRQTLTYEA